MCRDNPGPRGKSDFFLGLELLHKFVAGHRFPLLFWSDQRRFLFARLFAVAQRARAALRARALRSSLVIAARRLRAPAPLAARPPRRPRATAAGFFRRFVMVVEIITSPRRCG